MHLLHSFRAATLLLASSLTVTAQIYHWSAFAGLAPQWGTADGTGTDARFFSPQGIVATTAGLIYVCDFGNHTIRRIAANGAVTTLAGAPGQSGAVDGTGSAARFLYPSGITLVNGFYYITDRGNHAIRRMSSSGSVTTFAGRLGVTGSADGSGTNARFNNPAAINYDSNGNLFVADRENHVIRKITPDGEVSTFVGLSGTAGSSDGTGTGARFNRPSELFVTTGNVMYVADTYNHTIRRVTADGVVTTIAGSPGLSGAVNASEAAARFRYPSGVLAYSSGTVLVVDEAHAIRMIAANGTVSTYAGRLDVMGSRDGPLLDARFFIPTALTFLVDGIAVTDSFNQSVRKISLPSGDVTTIAGSPGSFGRQDGIGPAARFNFPNGVAVHSSGDVYLADSRGNTIRRISPNGQVVRVAGATGGGDDYVDGSAEVQSLNYPFGLAVAPDRSVYFCEQQRHTIRVLHADGSVSTLAGREGVSGSTDGRGAAARFSLPSGIALDQDGNLYIADYGNHTIRRIAAGTDTVTTFAGQPLVPGSADGTSTARFRGPRGVATDSDGNVYVADNGNHTIRKVSRSGEVTTLAGLAQISGSANGVGAEARFWFPTSIAVDAQGTLFITDGSNHTIRRCIGNTVSTIGGAAQVIGFRDGTGTTAVFYSPSGIAVDGGGNLYVSEPSNNVVRRGVILATPVISSHPQSSAVPVGGTAGFSVNATGGGLSYQWRLGGMAISGATGSTYTIPNASAVFAGSYTVTVSNALGSVTSQAATLTIAPASDAGRIINLSILTSLLDVGDSFTMGFVIGGRGTTGTKPLVIRGAGPALGALGVPSTLDDPKLELFFGSTSVGGNDNWGGSATLAAAMSSVGAFAYADPTSRDAATAGDFASGNNSVKLSAASNGTGSVIAEIYDASPVTTFTTTTPRLINVSVLKHLGSGLTAGFAIGGLTSKTVLVRAVGPTLADAPFGVAGVVADPQLALFAGATQIGSNDNWGGTAALTTAFGAVGAFPLPSSSRDAAIVAALQPGTYTVQVSGVGGSTGIAIIEIYEVP